MNYDDTLSIYFSTIQYILVIYSIFQSLLDIDRLLHLILLIAFPKTVHPKMDETILSTTAESDYPLIAIQLPMMDELECCESAIACACNLDWPKNRLIVQVLDDSTRDESKILIDNCVKEWIHKDVQIYVHRRSNRQGYKAGSLNFGMQFIRDVDFIAIFDADFLPNVDFLHRTVPALMRDPKIAFAQVRWVFTNANENFLTRVQEMGLNFHHRCEQESRHRSISFCTFNGTGGIWRRSAIEDIGGWHTDTLTEDFDLSFRAYIYGWRSVYLRDVTCLNELPPTLSAYFSQQYRWSCGLVQVSRKVFLAVLRSKWLTWDKKLYCSWILIRGWLRGTMCISTLLVMPYSILASSGDHGNVAGIIWKIINGVAVLAFTPEKGYLMFSYMMFMNAMSFHQAYAIVTGLFDSKEANQWIITQKHGSFASNVSTIKTHKSPNMIIQGNSGRLSRMRIYLVSTVQSFYQLIDRKYRAIRLRKSYLVIGLYLLFISFIAFRKAMYLSGIYILLTASMHFIIALGWMGR